jgi:transcriptional regulator with XRE-family HTH domain
MNSRQLATRLDVSEATVSRLLSNDRRPSVDLMVKISEVFPRFTVNVQVQALAANQYGALLKAAMKTGQLPPLTRSQAVR